MDNTTIPGFKKPNRYFILSFILVFAFICFRFPSLSYNAELFAETGWMFLPNALNNGVLDNLLQTEAGYWPVFQNILAVIVVKILGIFDHYPVAMQMFSVLFIAFFASALNFKSFKSVIESDSVRFIVGLTIGFGIMSEYEVYTFINFTYYGIVYALFILYLDVNGLPLKYYVPALVLAVLVLTSKPHFFFFVPVLFILSGYFLFRKKKKAAIFHGILIVMMIIEAAVMVKNSRGWTQGNHFTLPALLGDTLLYYVQLWNSIIFKNIFPRVGLAVISVICVIVVFIAYRLYKAKQWRGLYFFALCNYLTLASLFLNMKTMMYLKHSVSVGDYLLIRTNRHFLITNILVYLCLISAATLLLKRPAYRYLSVMLVVAPFVFIPFKTNDSYPDYPGVPKRVSKAGFIPTGAYEFYPARSESSSQWDIYKNLIYDEMYCIPVNPYPQVILKNCEEINAAVKKVLGQYSYGTESYAFFGRMSRADLTSSTNWWNYAYVKVIMFENEEGIESRVSRLNITALDAGGKKLAVGRQLTPMSHKHQYFMFDKPVQAAALEFSDQDGKPVVISPRMKFYGLMDVDGYVGYLRQLSDRGQYEILYHNSLL